MKNGFFNCGDKNQYNDLYMDLIETQGDMHGIDGKRLWLPIDPLTISEVDLAVNISRLAFKHLNVGREGMMGRCFSRVFDASLALCQAKIRHTVTIGNVFVDKRPYYATTPDSISRDMDEGYVHGEPAMAHSWITLENGVLLDFTIRYSIAHREGKRLPKLIQGIYRNDEPSVRKIMHVPMLLGPMYDLTVVSMPNSAAYEKAFDWVSMILALIDREIY